MRITYSIKTLLTFSPAAIASAGIVTTAAPEADAGILTLTGSATITSSDAALAGTDFVVGETITFDLDIDTDAIDIVPTFPTVAVYNDGISGNVNVGSTYEGVGAPSDLTVIDDAVTPSEDTVGFGFSNGNLVSNIAPNSNTLSGIIFDFSADTSAFSGIDITNVNELPNFDTGTLEFVFNANTANQINVIADVNFNTVNVVPEPSSMTLLGLGGTLLLRRRSQ